ncbi:hypothetical protein OSTOST_20509 [Ostertagia ostertagi]
MLAVVTVAVLLALFSHAEAGFCCKSRTMSDQARQTFPRFSQRCSSKYSTWTELCWTGRLKQTRLFLVQLKTCTKWTGIVTWKK